MKNKETKFYLAYYFKYIVLVSMVGMINLICQLINFIEIEIGWNNYRKFLKTDWYIFVFCLQSCVLTLHPCALLLIRFDIKKLMSKLIKRSKTNKIETEIPTHIYNTDSPCPSFIMSPEQALEQAYSTSRRNLIITLLNGVAFFMKDLRN